MPFVLFSLTQKASYLVVRLEGGLEQLAFSWVRKRKSCSQKEVFYIDMYTHSYMHSYMTKQVGPDHLCHQVHMYSCILTCTHLSLNVHISI